MAPRESQPPADLTIPATAQRTLDWSTRIARSAAWSAATAAARPLLVQSSAIPWLSRLAEQPQSGGGLADTFARRFAPGAFRTPETELTLSRYGAVQRQLDAARRSASTAPERLPAARVVARAVEPDEPAETPPTASPPQDQAARSRTQPSSSARPPSQPGPAASAPFGGPTIISRQSEKEAPVAQHTLAVPPAPFTASGAALGDPPTRQPAAPGRNWLSRSASPALPAVSRQEIGLLRRAQQGQGRPISRQEGALQLGEQRLSLVQPFRHMGLVSFAPEIRHLAQPAALPLARPAAESPRSGEIASGAARVTRTTGNMPGQQSIPHQAHPNRFPPLQRVVTKTPAAQPALGSPQAELWTNRAATIGQRRAGDLHAPLVEQPGAHTAHAAPTLPLVGRSTPADSQAHPPAEALGLPATPLLRAAVSTDASANDGGPDTPPASFVTVFYPALQRIGQPRTGLFGSSTSRSGDLPTESMGQTTAVPPDIRLQRASLAADIGDRLAHTHRGAGTAGSIGRAAGASAFPPGSPLQRLSLAAGAPARPILAKTGGSAAGGRAPAAADIPLLSSALLQRAGLPPADQGAAAATLPATDRVQPSFVALALPAVRTHTHHSQADMTAGNTAVGPRRLAAAELPPPATDSDTPMARLPLMLPLSVADAPTRRSVQGAGDLAQRLLRVGPLWRVADTQTTAAGRVGALVSRSAQGLSDDIAGRLSEPRDMLTAAQDELELPLVSPRQAVSPAGGLEAGPPGLVEPWGRQPRSAASGAGDAAYEPLDFALPQSVVTPAMPDMPQVQSGPAQTAAAGASGTSAGGVAEPDIDVLAQKVYDRLRRTAQIEQERLGRW